MIPVADEAAKPKPTSRKRRSVPKIFLTYRILDSQSATGRIKDHLEAKYGPENVFQDVEGIGLGQYWSDEIKSSLQRCDVQLVVIGPTFLTIADKDGNKRLFNEGDWVTGEIRHGLERSALAAGRPLAPGGPGQSTLSAGEPKDADSKRTAKPLRVIPVMVDGAPFPFPADSLPEPIQDLLAHQAVTIRNTSFPDDIRSLTRQIRKSGYYIVGIPKPLFYRAAAALGVVAALVGGFLASRGPAKMTGDKFNIAVAEFQTVDANGKAMKSSLGRSVSRAVAKALPTKQPSLTADLRFWSGTAGSISGSSDEERLESAISIAEDRGADLVIYGTIVEKDGLVTVEPAFLTSNRHLTGELQMLFNTYYSSPPSVPLKASSSPELVAAPLIEESASLTRLFAGLNRLRDGSWKDAADRIKPLNDTKKEPGWAKGLVTNPSRSSIVSYVLGAAESGAGATDRWNKAEALFNDALANADDFALAKINLGQIAYFRAKGECTAETIDRDGLAGARARLLEIANTADAPGDAAPKAAYVVSDIAMCELDAGVGTFGEAKRWLTRVIDSYETHPDMTEYVAYAGGRLGLLLATRAFDYSSAKERLDEAIELMSGSQDRAIPGQADKLRAFRSCVEELEKKDDAFQKSGAPSKEDVAAFRATEITNECNPRPPSSSRT